MNALDLTLGNPALPGAGFEPKVVGTAFASKAGQISKPIEGNSGVYVVVTKTVTKAPAIKDFKEQVTQLSAQAKGNAGRIMSALRTEADIEDNRADFY
jgi:peptidyl-prolyl cis-trans isomerase D